ncbi:MAG: T9SS type A sorting domain-containing protein [Bacteroidota bacterium]
MNCKNFYTYCSGPGLCRSFFGSLLLLLFFHSPLTAQTEDDCEGVPFTIEFDMIRGVCESGEQAIVDVYVQDGTNPGEEFFYDFADGSFTDIQSGGSVRLFSLAANTELCVTINRQETENCMQTACITIPAVTTLNCQLTVDNNVGCEGEASGVLTASVSGGMGDVTYQWDSEVIDCSVGGTVTDVTAENGPSITNLAPGKYFLTVTDASGCSANRKVCSIEICPPAAINATLEATQPDCSADATNGAIVATATGGSGVLSYAWSGPDGYTATGESISNLIPGLFTLTITDEAGCSFVTEVELVDPGCEPEPPEDPEEPCDCEMEADGVELFDIPIYKLVKKKKKRNGRVRYCYRWVEVGMQKVRFIGTSYNEEHDLTTFTYRVSNCDDKYNIRNAIFGNVSRNFQDCYRPGTVWFASGAECVYWKRYDRTGISGVKYSHICWHESDCVPSYRVADLTYTMPGQVGVSTTSGFSFGIKSGGRVYGRVEVPGPDCDTFVCPGGNDRMMNEEDPEAVITITSNNREENTNQDRTMGDGGNASNTPATVTPISEAETEESSDLPDATLFEELAEEDAVSVILDVYPNPFVEYVNVMLDSETSAPVTVEVTDAAGKLVESRTVEGGFSTQRIDMSNQANGIYLIRVKGDDISTAIHKVIKR